MFLWVGYYLKVLTKDRVCAPEIAGKFFADNCAAKGKIIRI